MKMNEASLQERTQNKELGIFFPPSILYIFSANTAPFEFTILITDQLDCIYITNVYYFQPMNSIKNNMGFVWNNLLFIKYSCFQWLITPFILNVHIFYYAELCFISLWMVILFYISRMYS